MAPPPSLAPDRVGDPDDAAALRLWSHAAAPDSTAGEQRENGGSDRDPPGHCRVRESPLSSDAIFRQVSDSDSSSHLRQVNPYTPA
ncbi:hypothetical protein E2562_021063 [Oryza meyeriana var. granulata]|uniref:Uncharacterized protein n=1 Tax=Oryza meyeriana var. granulata TaxID=110450 RepID=A0A6G1FAY8_9ORYZ|nr:hypothetical protein E2562_021063 [Oryza meyeriana var. granulata]